MADGLRSVPEPVRQAATAMGFGTLRRLDPVERAQVPPRSTRPGPPRAQVPPLDPARPATRPGTGGRPAWLRPMSDPPDITESKRFGASFGRQGARDGCDSSHLATYTGFVEGISDIRAARPMVIRYKFEALIRIC